MRKPKIFALTVVLGAVLAVALVDSNWLLAAVIGACFVGALWVFVHAYPRDVAPPTDRRHENTQRRRAGLKPR